MKSKDFGLLIAGLLALGLFIVGGAYMMMQEDTAHSFDSMFEEDRKVDTHKRPIMENRIEGAVEDDSDSDSDMQARTAVAAKGIVLEGRVVERSNGLPVSEFRIEVRQRVDRRGWEKVALTSFQDRDGEFMVPLEHEGAARVFVLAEGYALAKTNVEPSAYGEEGNALLIELDRGYTVSGIVMDAATREPLEGAEIMAVYDEVRYLAPIDPDALRNSTKSDARGEFELQGIRSDKIRSGLDDRVVIAASHPDFAQGYVKTKLPRKERIEIELHPGYRIFGRTLDDEGRPMEGVMVSAASEDVYMPLMVISDAKGRYETTLIPPGTIRVLAHAYQSNPAQSFTEESRTVEIRDRDVELNFGPEPDHVTWAGTLYGYDGASIAGGKIEMRLLGGESMERGRFREKRVFYSDDAGRFEVRKLLRGVYSVDVFLFNPQCHTEWENLSVKDAGTFLQKDIRLSGSEIAGTVIDGWSGKPMRGKSGTVHATRTGPSMKGFSSRVNGQGRFRLIGLPAGIFDITVAMEGFPPQFIHGLRLEERESKGNLEVTIPAGGKALIRFEGFAGRDVSFFEMSLEHGDGQVYGFPRKNVDPAGAWEEMHTLELGRWKLCLYFEELGYMEQEFDILHGETTRVVIEGGRLVVHPGYIALSGHIRLAGGEPMPDAMIAVYADRVPGLDEEGMSLTATTDSEGRFEMGGAKPGRWNVRVMNPGGAEAVLPDLVVPHHVTDTFYVELIYPGGVVTGELFDGETGQPFSDDAEGPRWWIYLHDVKTRESVSELQGGHKGARFRLEGVPAGTLQLTVSALGYIDSRSEAFDFDGGELDVGRVVLHPCGIVDLEVFTEDDRPVSDFEVLCGDIKLSNRNRQYLSPGKYRYYQVPLGPTEMQIEAEGFSPQTHYIDLTPGTPEYVRIILR